MKKYSRTKIKAKNRKNCFNIFSHHFTAAEIYDNRINGYQTSRNVAPRCYCRSISQFFRRFFNKKLKKEENTKYETPE